MNFKQLNEAFDRLNEKALNEGPGAGYNFYGTATIKVDNVKVLSKEDYKYSTTYEVSFNGRGTADIDFTSYYYGGSLKDVPVVATKAYVGVETGVIDNGDNVEQYIESLFYNEELIIDLVYGGGSSHLTYDGTIASEEFAAENTYADIAVTDMKITDEDIIQYIDDVVLGTYENDDYFEESLSDDIRKGNLDYDDEIDAHYKKNGNVVVQFQDRNSNMHIQRNPKDRFSKFEKQPRVSSHTWGRIWKDGNLVKSVEDSKYGARQEIAKYLDDNSMGESLEEYEISESLKRISRYGEFNNGHVIHNDWRNMSDKEAEDMAKQRSAANPNDIYYVAYDNVMNPSSDLRWIAGEPYNYSEVQIKNGKPFIKSVTEDRVKSTKTTKLKEDASKEWKPNTSFAHIKKIYNDVKKRGYKYVNNELEEMHAAMKKVDARGYTPEQRKQIRSWNEEIWRAHKKNDENINNESLKNRTLKELLPEGINVHNTYEEVKKNAIYKAKKDGYDQLIIKDSSGDYSFTRKYPSYKLFDDEQIVAEVKSTYHNGIAGVEVIEESLKESYDDVNSDNAFDVLYDMVELFGCEEMLDALAKAMGTYDLADNLTYICRQYEYDPNPDSVDESLNESNQHEYIGYEDIDENKYPNLKEALDCGAVSLIIYGNNTMYNESFDKGLMKEFGLDPKKVLKEIKDLCKELNVRFFFDTNYINESLNEEEAEDARKFIRKFCNGQWSDDYVNLIIYVMGEVVMADYREDIEDACSEILKTNSENAWVVIEEKLSASDLFKYCYEEFYDDLSTICSNILNGQSVDRSISSYFSTGYNRDKFVQVVKDVISRIDFEDDFDLAEEIDSALIYDEDLWSVIEFYLDPDDIINGNGFDVYMSFVNDVEDIMLEYYSTEDKNESLNEEESPESISDNDNGYSLAFVPTTDVKGKDFTNVLCDILNKAGIKNCCAKKRGGKYHVTVICPSSKLATAKNIIENCGFFKEWFPLNNRGKNESLKEERGNYGHKGPFWYYSKHGMGPGTLPKDVKVVDWYEDDDYNTWVALDNVLTTQELKDYDLKEQKPPIKDR